MTRPPHRPSRRNAVVEAAMGLFALHPPDRVTVADIAAAADMTAAAVYYHFPSREHVLLEGLQTFTDRYLAKIRELCRRSGDEDFVRLFITDLLEWSEEVRLSAIVYFTHSAGVDAAIEALRRETRIEEVVMLARAIRAHTRGPRGNVHFEVAAIGLVSLLENASSSWLTQDAVFVGLGRRRFVAETVALAERIIGAANSPSTPNSSGGGA
jgi:AcrR family transcriptional regulator